MKSKQQKIFNITPIILHMKNYPPDKDVDDQTTMLAEKKR
jgi:hypothetical protein